MLNTKENQKEGRIVFWLLFIVFGLLMLLVGYLLGNFYPTQTMKTEEVSHSKVATINAVKGNRQELVKEEKLTDLKEQKILTNNASNTTNISGYQHDFRITYLNDWSIQVENTDFSTDVTLVKGDFKVLIRQADNGSLRCVYPDEGDFKNDLEYPNVRYSTYSQFSGNYTFRHEDWTTTSMYEVCSKDDKDGIFSLYTPVGFISYEVPAIHTQKELSEMDKIIKSIEVLK